MNYTCRFSMEIVIADVIGHPEKNIVQDIRKVSFRKKRKDLLEVSFKFPIKGYIWEYLMHMEFEIASNFEKFTQDSSQNHFVLFVQMFEASCLNIDLSPVSLSTPE